MFEQRRDALARLSDPYTLAAIGIPAYELGLEEEARRFLERGEELADELHPTEPYLLCDLAFLAERFDPDQALLLLHRAAAVGEVATSEDPWFLVRLAALAHLLDAPPGAEWRRSFEALGDESGRRSDLDDYFDELTR